MTDKANSNSGWVVFERNLKSFGKSLKEPLRKVLASLLTAAPWLLIIGGGLGIYSSTRILIDDSENLNQQFINAVSIAALSGGFFTFLVNSFQYMGVFKESVRDVMLEDALLSRRADLPDLWKKISSLIADNRFPALSHEMHSQMLEGYMPSENDYYYRDYQRSCHVMWENDDPTTKVLQMTETVSMIVVPTDRDTTIPFKFAFVGSDGADRLPSAEHHIDLRLLTIDGVRYVVNNEQVSVTTERSVTVEEVDDMLHCTIDLSGQDEYEVKREICRTFKPSIDPIQECTSERFIKSARIIVQCKPENLRVRFINMGTPVDFDYLYDGLGHRSRHGDIMRHYPGLLFPRQGYGLYFQVLSDDLVEAAKLEAMTEAKLEAEQRAARKQIADNKLNGDASDQVQETKQETP